MKPIFLLALIAGLIYILSKAAKESLATSQPTNTFAFEGSGGLRLPLGIM